jgi:hypothetical protein
MHDDRYLNILENHPGGGNNATVLTFRKLRFPVAAA